METKEATREELKARLRSKQQQARQRRGGGGGDTRAAATEALLSMDDAEALRVATAVLRDPSSARAQLERLVQTVKKEEEEEEEEEEAPPELPSKPPRSDLDDELPPLPANQAATRNTLA